MKKTIPRRKRKKYIDPLNPYTGEVSVMTIMENLKNGHDTFPKIAEDCIRPLR